MYSGLLINETQIEGSETGMADTSIEWTDATWNPVAGLRIVSAGCSNCYAMRMAARLKLWVIEKYRGLTRKSGGRYVWTGQKSLSMRRLSLFHFVGNIRARYS